MTDEEAAALSERIRTRLRADLQLSFAEHLVSLPPGGLLDALLDDAMYYVDQLIAERP